MAYHKRKDFGAMCNIRSGDLSNYIKRGKVILSGELIDDSLYENAEFMRKRAGVFPSTEKVIVKTTKSVKPVNNTKVESFNIVEPERKKEVSPRFEEPRIPAQSYYDSLDDKARLEAEKKALEVEKLKKENRILKSKAEKLEGELIPTDLVKSLIRELSEAMKIAYMESIETYTVIVSAQKKLTNDEVSGIKKHFTGLINDTISKQVVVAKKMLSNIVNEYSMSRGRGERY